MDGVINVWRIYGREAAPRAAQLRALRRQRIPLSRRATIPWTSVVVGDETSNRRLGDWLRAWGALERARLPRGEAGDAARASALSKNKKREHANQARARTATQQRPPRDMRDYTSRDEEIDPFEWMSEGDAWFNLLWAHKTEPFFAGDLVRVGRNGSTEEDYARVVNAGEFIFIYRYILCEFC